MTPEQIRLFTFFYLLNQNVGAGFSPPGLPPFLGSPPQLVKQFMDSTILKNVVFQNGMTFFGSAAANHIQSQAPLAEPEINVFSHVPIVVNFINAASSPAEQTVRIGLVTLVYGGAGALTCISTEAACSMSPTLVAFAQYMVLHSCIVFFPSKSQKFITCIFIYGKFIYKVFIRIIAEIRVEILRKKFCLPRRIFYKKIKTNQPKTKRIIRFKRKFKVIPIVTFGKERLVEHIIVE